MVGNRYDELAPEQVARERARRRLANRRTWVNTWWPRIAAKVKGEASDGKEEHRSD